MKRLLLAGALILTFTSCDRFVSYNACLEEAEKMTGLQVVALGDRLFRDDFKVVDTKTLETLFTSEYASDSEKLIINKAKNMGFDWHECRSRHEQQN